ncbi:MAG TPA: hypothetical protein VK745_09310 [Polyangiaceae bacterium]|jgi:hypothetical protein|nr:hypothetical protein [Polyangiaceae bacterium]
MRTGSWVLLSAVVLAAGAAASGCSSGSAHGAATGADSQAGACQGSGCDVALEQAAGAGGEAGADGESVTSAACVPQGGTDVPDDAFVDSNCDGIDGDKSAAIFASPDGDDKADGAFGAPVKSLAKAVELAASAGKAVYACVGDFTDNVVIDTKAVSIFGGYDCKDWSRSNARPTVKPASGIALTVRNATGVTVDRMSFVAATATDPSASSIAVEVAASNQVSLSHLELDAGDGAAGLAGETVSGLATSAQNGSPGGAGLECQAGLVSCSVTRVEGGDGLPTYCGGTQVHGGTGGADGPYPRGYPSFGLAGTPGTSGSGYAGPSGLAGEPGVLATAGFGSVTDAGYVASNSGADGKNGENGQSGGGGTGGYSCYYGANTEADCAAGNGQLESQYYYGSGGGQGGYGGCGGMAGHGGGAGGASIALLSINSTVSLSWSSLTTGSGGAGGVPSDGASGQLGGAGGKAGAPTSWALGMYAEFTNGQDGGSGGDGGHGGPGGAGGGGPSVTLVALGTAPTTEAVTFTPGAGGTGGPGLAGQDGASGESKEVEVIGGDDAGAAGATGT